MLFLNKQFVLISVLLMLFFTISNAMAMDSDKIEKLQPPKTNVLLKVSGAINNTNIGETAQFDWAMLQKLPQTRLKTTTSVTDGVHVFDGILVRDLLEYVGASGTKVIATALNYYSIEFPIEEFYDYDIILAFAMDGKRLQPSNKGPLWIVYPRDDHAELQDIRYDYRWVWQLVKLDIL